MNLVYLVYLLPVLFCRAVCESEIEAFPIEEEMIRQKAPMKTFKDPSYFRIEEFKINIILGIFTSKEADGVAKREHMIRLIDENDDQIITPQEIQQYILARWTVVLEPSKEIAYKMFHAASGDAKVLTYNQCHFFGKILANNMLQRIRYALTL